MSPGFLRDSGTFGKAKDLELTNIKDVREEGEDAERSGEKKLVIKVLKVCKEMGKNRLSLF